MAAATTETVVSKPDATLALEPKRSGETKTVAVDFVNRIPTGAAITSADTWVVTVKSGTDATPSALLDGSPSTSGAEARQSLTAGTDGVVYYVVAQVTLDDDQILEQLMTIEVQDAES